MRTESVSYICTITGCFNCPIRAIEPVSYSAGQLFSLQLSAVAASRLVPASSLCTREKVASPPVATAEIPETGGHGIHAAMLD